MSISENDPLVTGRHLDGFVKPLDRQMQELARAQHVLYVSMYRLFCDESCNPYAAPGVPLLSDYEHLTKVGSVLAARRITALGVLPEFGAVARRWYGGSRTGGG